ncbi:Heparan-alpha-glucosaminide N-acetyltransferase [Sesamum angolense]|uniref:Heparan-alpha-glucosaminide N-acetyltransferase n=1 Tax=Sesamum angolense TaxID=2727404 RepID=A0AAE2BS23_9LAMI|nr:Heparan-alpha-glucosaminide N-acetyltransferase [Sesamum angolense]
MASYQLIKESDEDGALDLERKDCTLHVEGYNVDVESAFQKINPSSPPLQSGSDTGANAASRGTSTPARLVSLDVFRGLTVVLMIVVDDAGGILPTINHSPWNGLTLADVVMPFFLFMVGVSLALVYKNMSSGAAASKKAILRALKLLILGVFLQAFLNPGQTGWLTLWPHGDTRKWGHPVARDEWGIMGKTLTCGTRWLFPWYKHSNIWRGHRSDQVDGYIAVAYLVAAMCEIWLRNDEKVSSGLSLLKKYQWHWNLMFMLSTIYLLLLYGLYVPDWEYQIPIGAPSEAKYSSVNSPDYGPLPPNAPPWCQAPFDPEGILSTVMAIVTCLIGLQFGHIIVHFKDHRNRLLLWLAPSSAFIVLGLLCDVFGMHINKALYSFSYMRYQWSCRASTCFNLFGGWIAWIQFLNSNMKGSVDCTSARLKAMASPCVFPRADEHTCPRNDCVDASTEHVEH